MQYIELSPVAAFLLRMNIITAPAGLLANWCWYASILPRKDSKLRWFTLPVVVMKINTQWFCNNEIPEWQLDVLHDSRPFPQHSVW